MALRLFVNCVFFSVLVVCGHVGAKTHDMAAEVDDHIERLFELSPALAIAVESIESQINSIAVEYNKRFVNGKNVITPAIRDAFIAKQSGLIAQLKRDGKMARSFRVLNSFKSSLVFTVSLVQEGGRFVAVVIEKSKYDNKDDQAGLWVYSILQLKKGRSLFRSGNIDLIALRSDSLNPENGGEIYVKYPTNVKNNTFAETGISILKSTAGDFSFFTIDRAGFSQIKLNIWVNIFDGPNYGVDRVDIK